MPIAPTPILKAGLWTLHRAVLLLRQSTYEGSEVDLKAINDLTDTIHNIPMSLMEWDEAKHLEEIRIFLKAFNKSLWPGGVAPDFLEVFEEKLKEEMEKGN